MSEKIVEFVTGPDGRIVSHPRGAAIKDGWHETTPAELAASVKAEADRVKAEADRVKAEADRVKAELKPVAK